MELQTAIYTTLLHSLWMGLILALVTSLIIVSTRKRSAALRYNLLAAALMTFVLSICFVFYRNFNDDVVEKQVFRQEITSKSPVVNKFQAVVDDSFLASARSAVSLWANYSNQIVLIWFLIICAKSVQLLIGLHGIRHIKTTKVFSAGSLWEQKVVDISKKLSITKPVLILQSGLAKVPMIVGHFKPVILVPLGLLNGLGVDEVEAIISHELAHLKRNDYMVNLFQSFVEIVFFFNPGVLWISKLIKEERENCCDDLALSCTESKYQYIKALISCQEFSANYQNYAMAITGRKNTLKDRVSRMVFDSNSSLNRIEKTILSIGLVSLLIFSTAFTKVRTYVKENRILTAKEVTVFFGQAPLDTTKRQVVKKFPQKVRSNVDKPKNAAEVKARQNDVKRYQADVKRQQNNIIEYQANMLKYQDDMKKYQTDLARCVADPINNKLPVAPTVPVIAQTPSAPTAPSVHKTTTVRAVKNANTSVSVYTPINVSPNISVNLGHIQPLVAEKKVSMTDELRIQGLLKDLNNFEYKLNAEEFVINGVKQSEDIHRKYMKYLKNKKGTITTTVSTD